MIPPSAASINYSRYTAVPHHFWNWYSCTYVSQCLWISGVSSMTHQSLSTLLSPRMMSSTSAVTSPPTTTRPGTGVSMVTVFREVLVASNRKCQLLTLFCFLFTSCFSLSGGGVLCCSVTEWGRVCHSLHPLPWYHSLWFKLCPQLILPSHLLQIGHQRARPPGVSEDRWANHSRDWLLRG